MSTPITIYATNGEDYFPLVLTKWCPNCKGVMEDAKSCPSCNGRRTINTATGNSLRQFLADQLS